MEKHLDSGHWADVYAEKVLREKGEKEIYTCASGITPSGTVHIGNFREIISVDLVVRALRDRGKQVRFIYSWDDYDVFRKVPKNMPQPELLAKYLRQPIVDVPDTRGIADNYARANEIEVEKTLPSVGIHPDYLYQAQKYRASSYAQGIRTALEKKDLVKEILDEHRSEELGENWWPVSVFSSFNNRDETEILAWDGEWSLTYKDEDGNQETIDLRNSKGAKLPWRLDWPMRWSVEKVDFEPAGKDHHSDGGSWTTAQRMVKEVFNWEAPVTFQYDFISIKGRGGKISSSSGEVISLPDVLEVYTPELTRYLFAGTRPNAEFAISFDLDVLKIYEDYDKCERIYYGAQAANEKETAKQSRIYELSQPEAPAAEMPYQVTIRHLSTFLQAYDGDIERTLKALPEVKDYQLDKLRVRANCAWAWVTSFAPEDFRFSIRKEGQTSAKLEGKDRAAAASLYKEVLNNFDTHDEKTLHNRIYDIARDLEMDTKDLFRAAYQALIGKDQGPRLASFLMIIGKETLLRLLSAYKDEL
ncbi:MAG: lysine--tRNA ligase [Spirochaetes bacterium GWB1_48_6]|nr:MAG: lysine--tRNA ligase [Spirochaetes bacterium GWB1_48_6]